MTRARLTDAPADIAPSNKTYKKGDLVWYKQRDGAVVSAKVWPFTARDTVRITVVFEVGRLGGGQFHPDKKPPTA